MSNDLSIFDFEIDDLQVTPEEKPKADAEIYKPKADEGEDNTYEALIRFLPNPENPRKPIVSKYVYWLVDKDNKGQFFDCPSTVGKRGKDSPIQQLFFQLNRSESALDRDNAGKLKRREQHYSLIQIIKDTVKPDNNGKIMVFRYGTTIKQMIESELNPKFEEGTNVFDLFAGKNFVLRITKKQNFNNYDSSKFQGKVTPITIGDQEMERNADDMQKIKDMFEGAPKLSKYEYREWTEEQKAKVFEILNLYRPAGEKISALNNESSSDHVVDDSTVDEILEEATSTSSSSDAEDAPFDTDEPTKSQAADASSEDDIESFLDDLDLD